MSNQEMNQYLDMLSNKIAVIYNISREYSEQIVAKSPMRELLREDAEYVYHMPLRSWAEMVYNAHRLSN